MTPEKELILDKFNTLMYIDNNIASIVDNYIYQNVIDLSGSYFRKFTGRYGKFHGEYIEYFKEDFPNKIESISNWKNGVLNGERRSFWFSGQLYFTVMYKDGLKEGDELQYHKNGKMWCIKTYKKGILEGEQKEWLDNGTPRLQLYFKGGKREGEYKEYNYSGKLKVHTYYKEGILEGEFNRWYDNGKLSFKTNHKEGKLDGELKEWDQDGKLIDHLQYKDGLKIKDYLNKDDGDNTK